MSVFAVELSIFPPPGPWLIGRGTKHDHVTCALGPVVEFVMTSRGLGLN